MICHNFSGLVGYQWIVSIDSLCKFKLKIMKIKSNLSGYFFDQTINGIKEKSGKNINIILSLSDRWIKIF